MRRTNLGGFIWIAVLVLFMNGGLLESLFSIFSNPSVRTEYDYNMDTADYQVDVQVGEDCSYDVTEKIQVDFRNERHGIYRYIPLSGSSVYVSDAGDTEKLPYRGAVSAVRASEPVAAYQENGNQVLRLGDEYSYVYGFHSYEIHYKFQPAFQQEDYANVYYNIFPTQWANDIPEGSSFRITFPEAVDASKIHFYYGPYGSLYDGEDILDWEMNGNTLSGVLTDSLPMGNGLTIFADVGYGYFSSVQQVPHILVLPLAVALAVLLCVALLFVLFGKDEPMIPSIQYQPPEDLDSGAVGYIVDGVVENRDVISLIIYWADKGYLSIHEDGDGDLSFEKKGILPAGAPQYQKDMFNRLFLKGDYVSLSSLKYKFSETITAVKAAIRDSYRGGRSLYTGQSKAARGISLALCGLPFASFLWALVRYSYTERVRLVFYVCLVVLLYVGIAVFCRGVDTWHGRSSASRRALVTAGLGISFVSIAFFAGGYLLRVYRGVTFRFLPNLIAVAAVTAVTVVLTGFMRRRTHQCVEWMGRLVGLRDFIETAELDRMRALAQENPQWFYHIIPYAYVFGLSDVFAKKLEGLELEPPIWYETERGYGGSYFDYYLFHRMFMRNMTQVTQTLTMPKPPAPSSSGSNFGGGGFSGGGYSGGGFSGGGFGGGGGGSW